MKRRGNGFRTTLILPKQLKAKLVAYSRDFGLTQSELIRSAIVAKLQELAGGAKK